MKTDAEVLEEVADLLESGKVDWIKGLLFSNDGSRVTAVCAIGAIGYALFGDDLATMRRYSEARIEQRRQWSRIVDQLGIGLTPCDFSQQEALASWNNAPERQLHEVIDLFKEAAKDLQNEAEE